MTELSLLDWYEWCVPVTAKVREPLQSSDKPDGVPEPSSALRMNGCYGDRNNSESKRMIRHGSALINLADMPSLAGYSAAVSLHSHTDWSKEGMENVSPYLHRMPVLSRFVRRELNDYARRNNQAVDFTRAWWHPPVDAQSVLESETAQIAKRLGLMPIVSITDHDTLGANLELQRRHANSVVPVSCEWTVPFHEGFLHLGVHNLPPGRARDIFEGLSRHTQDPRVGELSRLLKSLNTDPELLIVLNHPLWDLAGVGAPNHVRLVRCFLAEHGGTIHALELNGYRSWHENVGVQALQRECPLPLMSGAIDMAAPPTCC